MKVEQTIDQKIEQLLIAYDEIMAAFYETGDNQLFKMAGQKMAKIELLYREKTRIK